MLKNKKLTKKAVKTTLKNRIVILLDSSSSMQSIRKEALDSFNEQVKTIKKKSKGMDTKVSFATFAGTSKTVLFNEDVKTLKPLNEDAYNPNGWTAMYDSVGAAIDALSFLPEANEEATSFLVIIISDGEENSSRLYNANDISSRVRRLQATNRWTFTYLGANQDLAKVSQNLGFHLGNTMSFSASSAGMRSATLTNSAALDSFLVGRANGATASTNFYNSDSTNVVGGAGGSSSGTLTTSNDNKGSNNG